MSITLSISVIIPTLNRADRLSKVLDSIKDQLDTAADMEVIIMDNGSTDNTKEISLSFQEKIRNLSYYYKPEPGLLTGRHAGAKLATGEVLCFLDDDIILESGYLKALRLLFSTNPDIHLATGPSLPAYEAEIPEWLPYLWTNNEYGKHCGWLSLIDFGNHIKEIHPNFVWGLNFCIRKATLIDLGGFHPDIMPNSLQKYQGDGETGLTLKAAEKGYKAVYCPQLALKHAVPKERLTLEYFKRRAFFQGVCESYIHLRRKYKATISYPEAIHVHKTLRDRLHPYYQWVKFFLPKKRDKTPVEVHILLTMLNEAEQSGYNFHQQQFYHNKKIREWVLKDTYWDYNSPEND